MAHTVEPATSGRSKCRGCGRNIPKGENRFGERLPSPYADGDMTLWYHVICAIYRRPGAIAEYVEQPDAQEAPFAELDRGLIDFGLAHRRVQRLTGVQRASSGRARCRQCRETITKGAWRIPLTFFEEGSFNPSGYVHVECAPEYFATGAILPFIEHFSDDLDPEAVDEIRQLLADSSGSGG